MWRYKQGGRVSPPIDEAAAADLIGRGVITPETMIYMEGAPNWQPARESALAHLFSGEAIPAASPVAAPEPPPLPAADAPPLPSQFRGKPPRNLTVLSGFVCAMLGLSLATVLVGLWSNWLQLGLANSATDGGLDAQAAGANDQRQFTLAMVQLSAFVLTGIFFLTWKYKAYRNLRRLGHMRLRYSAGWAAGAYFVPILNLFRPYQIMKELWRASEYPDNERHVQTPWLLPAWWALWLLSAVVGRISFQLSTSIATLSDLRIATWLQIATDLLSIPLHICAILLVRGIWRRQRAASAAMVQP